MKSRTFGQLIDLHLKGKLPPKVAKKVDEWEQHLGKEDFPGEWTEDDKENLKQRILKKTQQGGKVVYMTAYRIAASILLVAVTSYIIWNVWFRQAAMQVVTSIAGVTTKVKLKDGSIVWLKGESSLSYDDDFSDGRYVILKGEALFEVARDPNRAFTIDCGDVTAQVLGTSFNIKTKEDNNIEVLVLTGKVKVSSPDNEQGMAVLPNEKAIYYDKEDLLVKETAEKIEATTAVAGTEYHMAFDEAKVKDVVQRIEKKFDVTVTMNDPQLGGCNFTGDLTDHSLEQTLQLMAGALNFKYEIAGSKVTLQGGGDQCK
jgi:ferric-dicitrate binding protein FerR (iron transport regulator)